jgi:hypothetical protein
MPQKFKFGKISVSCEGYDYPEDPYILAGSCGVSEEIWKIGFYLFDFSWNIILILLIKILMIQDNHQMFDKRMLI